MVKKAVWALVKGALLLGAMYLFMGLAITQTINECYGF